MKYRSLPALQALALGASLLMACGGRSQLSHDLEDDPVSNSRGGAPSTGPGGPVVHAGAPSSAGARNLPGPPGSGGAMSGGPCARVDCAVPVCAKGTFAVIGSGECCAHCTSCPVCTMGTCLPGTHLEQLKGHCCPTCESDGIAVCQKGQRAYAEQRDAMLSKYRFGCASDSECLAYDTSNACDSCVFAPVWSGVVDSLQQSLINASEMYCAGCMPDLLPCAPPPSARCVSGACEFVSK